MQLAQNELKYQSDLPSFEEVLPVYADDMQQVNACITNRLERHIPFIKTVSHHLINAGGKRVRPLLTLISARLFGYQGQHHIPLAACVEYIHTATLLHDDVVDDSSERRGLETANLLWGNKPTILVGDFLFSRAFELMLEAKNLDVLATLSSAASNITEGELLQLTKINDIEMTEASYFEIIASKTAALFRAASEVGAILGGGSENDRAAMRQFGESIGCIFQILDDLLDYGIGAHNLGKNLGDDFYEGKVTLPVILTYQNGTAAERTFLQDCYAKDERTPEEFARVTELMQKHQVPARILLKTAELKSQAEQALRLTPNRPQRAELDALLTYCMDRCS